jgi:hypothetical protein
MQSRDRAVLVYVDAYEAINPAVSELLPLADDLPINQLQCMFLTSRVLTLIAINRAEVSAETFGKVIFVRRMSNSAILILYFQSRSMFGSVDLPETAPQKVNPHPRDELTSRTCFSDYCK